MLGKLSTKITFILVKGAKVMKRPWKPLRLEEAKEGRRQRQAELTERFCATQGQKVL